MLKVAWAAVLTFKSTIVLQGIATVKTQCLFFSIFFFFCSKLALFSSIILILFQCLFFSKLCQQNVSRPTADTTAAMCSALHALCGFGWLANSLDGCNFHVVISYKTLSVVSVSCYYKQIGYHWADSEQVAKYMEWIKESGYHLLSLHDCSSNSQLCWTNWRNLNHYTNTAHCTSMASVVNSLVSRLAGSPR